MELRLQGEMSNEPTIVTYKELGWKGIAGLVRLFRAQARRRSGRRWRARGAMWKAYNGGDQVCAVQQGGGRGRRRRQRAVVQGRAQKRAMFEKAVAGSYRRSFFLTICGAELRLGRLCQRHTHTQLCCCCCNGRTRHSGTWPGAYIHIHMLTDCMSVGTRCSSVLVHLERPFLLPSGISPMHETGQSSRRSTLPSATPFSACTDRDIRPLQNHHVTPIP